ncbi:MAG: DMT family transporter [Gemmatimonadota bacterium]|jgi:drug/metabolite transporter (DMT)-like permease
MSIPPLPALHLAALLFGAAGLFGELVLLPAPAIVLGRVTVGGVALGLIIRMRGERLVPARGTDLAGFVGLGALLAVHWVTFFHSIQLSSVAVGLVTYSTFPVFTALLEPALLRERWRWGDLGAALVTLVGVSLVVPRIDWASDVTRGAFWGVMSGLTFALLAVANRGYRRRYGALALTFHQLVWAAVVLLPLAAPQVSRATGRDLVLLALLGVVFTALAHGLFVWALEGIRARVASVVATLEPVYGIVLAALILGEMPSGRTLVGGAVILAAAAWVMLRSSDRAELAAPPGPAGA